MGVKTGLENTMRSQEQILEDILHELRGSGGRSGSGSGGNSSGTTTTGPSASNFDNLSNSAKDADLALKKLAYQLPIGSRFMKAHQEAVYANRRALDNLEQELKNAEKGLVTLSAAQKKELEGRKKTAQSYEDSDTATRATSSAINKLGSAARTLGSQLISGAIGVASAIQGGASGFGIAGAALEATANVQNTVMQGVAQGGQVAGTALMFGGGKAKLFGLAVTAASTALGVYSDLLTQAVTGANRIMIAEGEKLLQSYTTAVSAGAMLKNGADDMLHSLEGSNLTLQDYAEMVKGNTTLLAEANMGVGQASMMFGRVNKELGNNRRALVALGYSYQEQGALMSEVMSDLRKRDPQAELSDREVAKRTMEYAVNLRTLSSITGENGQKLKDQSKAITGTLMTQNFLAKLGDKGVDVANAFAALPKQVQQDIAERAQLGFVANETGRNMGLLSPAIAAMEEELLAAAKSGTLTQKQAEQIQEKYARQIQLQAQNNELLAKGQAVGNSILTPAAEATQAVVEWTAKFTQAGKTRAEAEEAARKNKEKADADPANKLTTTFLTMNEVGQNFRKELQEAIIPRLGDFAAALKNVMTGISEILAKGTSLPLTPWDSFFTWFKGHWMDLLEAGFLAFSAWRAAARVLMPKGAPEGLENAGKGEGAKVSEGAGKPTGNSAEATPTVPKAVMDEYQRLRASDPNMTATEAMKQARTNTGNGFKNLTVEESRLAGNRAVTENAVPKPIELPKVPDPKSYTPEGLKLAGKLTGKALRFVPYVAAGIMLYETAVEYGEILDELERTGNVGRYNNRIRELGFAVGGTVAGGFAGGAAGGALAATETVATGGLGAVAAPALVLGGGVAGSMGGSYVGRKLGQLYNWIWGDDENAVPAARPAPAQPANRSQVPGLQPQNSSGNVGPTSSYIDPKSITSLASAMETGIKKGFQVSILEFNRTLAKASASQVVSSLAPAQTFLNQVAEITNGLTVKVAELEQAGTGQSPLEKKIDTLIKHMESTSKGVSTLATLTETQLEVQYLHKDFAEAQATYSSDAKDYLRRLSQSA